VPETSLQHDHDRHDPVPVLSKGSEEIMSAFFQGFLFVVIGITALFATILVLGFFLPASHSTNSNFIVGIVIGGCTVLICTVLALNYFLPLS
jgi:hypothetical protein